METTGTISQERLAQLTGLPVVRLRQLAAEGFFPKAVQGQYRVADSVTGLFRYFQEACRRLPVYDSLEQCSGATGIPPGVLKAAKRKGSPAFASNRVYLDRLLRFLFDPQGSAGDPATMGIDELKRLKLTEETRLLTIERQKAEEQFVPMAEALALMHQCFGPVRERLLALPTELGYRLNPSDPRLAHAVLQEWVDMSLVMIRAGLPELREEGASEAPTPPPPPVRNLFPAEKRG